MRGRPQRLRRVHRAAITDERDHRPLRQRELHTERGGQPPADAATAQAEERLRVGAPEEIANAGGGGDGLVHDDHVVRHDARDRVHERQRPHRRLLRVVGRASREVVPLARVLRAQRLTPRAGVPVSRFAGVTSDGLAELGQRCLRITLDRDRRRIVLAELPGIDVQMHDVEARRHRVDVRGQREREEIAADGEQQVVAHQQRLDAGTQPRHRARVQRMREREAARRRHPLQHHRRADELGQLDQLGERVAVRDGVAGHDQRAGGGDEPLGRRVDRRAITDQPRRHPRRGEEVEVVALGVEHIYRQREKDGTGRLRERGLHRAAHEARQVLEPTGLRRPLHERRRHRRQIGPQNRLRHREGLIVLAGGEQQRRVGFVCVVQHAHRVAESRRDVHVHRRESAVRLRVGVGHRDGHRLLQREHVPDARLAREAVHQRQFGGARIAEHDRDAFALENLQERLLAR